MMITSSGISREWGVISLVMLACAMATTVPSFSLFGLTLGASVLITAIFGYYLATVFEDVQLPSWLRWLMPIERGLLRLIGQPHSASMSWQQYATALVLTNMLCGLIGFGILVSQQYLPLNPLHQANMEPWQAFNTVCSFITNTNWQSYSGEVTLTNLSQMLGITMCMFLGAASGLVVCLAFLRGLTHRPLGNYYQDFIRSLVTVFIPLSLLFSLIFVFYGVPQTLTQQVVVSTVEGHTQTIAMGPVASLLSIKQFGTNGGGFFNANSAHPFENPNAFTNWLEIMLELAIPMALVMVLGRWLNDKKQAWLIWSAMMLMFLLFWGTATYFETHGNTALQSIHGVVTDGGNLEGKEIRFGIAPSTLFVTSTTSTSTGAVNTMHDSLTPMGGFIPLWDMMLNVVFGGVGVGLMGFLLYGILAVFLTGLMVGRTPEIFGKKIEKAEMVLASLAILLHPLLILVPTAIAVMTPMGLSSLNNVGPHGLSEILYAYTSAAANNGSAFAGLNANTPWYNISIGTVIVLGRYVSIIILLALAGSLLSKTRIQPGPGTLKTNTCLFMTVWVAVILIVGALTFIPVLMLGPVAEHLAMQTHHVF